MISRKDLFFVSGITRKMKAATKEHSSKNTTKQYCFSPFTIKGKSIPMVKKLTQLTVPPIMQAAGREDCTKISAVSVLVMPPGPSPKLSMKANIDIMLTYGTQEYSSVHLVSQGER